MILGTTAGCHKFSIEEKFKMFVFALRRQRKSHEATEERMQSANKAFWKDFMIYQSKDVSWKVKCQRLVDHVYPVFTFGSENRSWTIQTSEKYPQRASHKHYSLITSTDHRCACGSKA